MARRRIRAAVCYRHRHDRRANTVTSTVTDIDTVTVANTVVDTVTVTVTERAAHRRAPVGVV